MTPEERQHFTAMLDSIGLVLQEQRRLLERVDTQLAHVDHIRLLLLDWLRQQNAREETP